MDPIRRRGKIVTIVWGIRSNVDLIDVESECSSDKSKTLVLRNSGSESSQNQVYPNLFSLRVKSYNSLLVCQKIYSRRKVETR